MLKKILSILFWIFVGILLTLGGIAYGGYWAYNNLTLAKVESLIGANIVDLGELNNTPIKGLVAEVSKITEMTIAEVDSKYLNNQLSSNLKISINGKNVDLTKSIFKNIMSAKVLDAPSKISSITDNLTFGMVYEDILLDAGFGLPAESTFLTENKNVAFTDAIGKINDTKIENLFESGKTFDNDKLNAIYQQIKTLTIAELNDSEKLDPKINSIKIGDIIEINSSSSLLMQSVKNFQIGELSTKINTLKLNEIIEIDSSSSKILQSLQNSTINSLSSDIDTLTLSDIVDDTSSSKILQSLQNSTMSTLATDINNLRLTDVMDLGDFNYDSDNDLINDSYKGFIGLLYETDSNVAGPKISEFATKMDTINVNVITLNELYARDIISSNDGFDSKDIAIRIDQNGNPITPTTIKLGACSLNQILDSLSYYSLS